MDRHSATANTEVDCDDGEPDTDVSSEARPVKRRAARGTHSNGAGPKPNQLGFYPRGWTKCIEIAKAKLSLHTALTDHFITQVDGEKLSVQFIGEAVEEMEGKGDVLEEGKCLSCYHFFSASTNILPRILSQARLRYGSICELMHAHECY